MRKPEEMDLGSYIFLRPMTGFLWLVFIVCVGLMVAVLYLVEKLIANKIEEARIAKLNQPGHEFVPPPAPPVGFCSHGICGSPR